MVTDLRLQNFRSYKDTTFEFGGGVNIIVGPNASGKTNLLEAVQLVCLGSSYRARDLDMISYDKPWAKLEAHLDEETRLVKLVLQPGQSPTKTFTINGQNFSRLSRVRSIPAVLFEPNHLQLLSGSPELRRDFLDDLLAQTTGGFDKLRRDYRRTLAQRNALLKREAPMGGAQLFAWNIRLSELGGQLATQRMDLVAKLSQDAGSTYQKLSGVRSEVGLNYSSTIPLKGYGTSLLKKLEASTELDFARGFTSYGPHRDDLEVILNQHSAQQTASRGEVRTLILMLKILELKLLEAESGKKPILLLDDVFSELDGKRRQALTKFLKNYQTFITTTDADVVVQHFMDKATIIPTSKNRA